MSVEKIEVKASKEVIAAWKSHFSDPTGDEGLTSIELAAIAGISPANMRKRLKSNIEKYDTGTGVRHDEMGRHYKVRVYRLKETT